MNHAQRIVLRLCCCLAALVVLRGCYSEGPRQGGPAKGSGPVITARDAGADRSITSIPHLPEGGNMTEPPSASTGDARRGSCRVARTMEPIPARSVAIDADAGTGPTTLFVADLFQSFKTDCGSCHVEDNQGSFHVAQSSFSSDMTDEVLTRIFSTDPEKVMPRAAGPANKRDAKTDKYLVLGSQLQAWYKQGKPKDLYIPEGSAAISSTNYRLSKVAGSAMTNLGNCIPSSDLLGINAQPMKNLDVFFAAATALPRTLDETDLTTFDSELLAQTGVISYAPAYPLWSDNARKMRHVRVPLGTSIAFDKATQQFDIPDNTRFYKTFFKKVIQKDGSERYQKMETRLIVARKPTNVDSNGDDVQNALFGTYIWDETETHATLVDDPLRDGTPWIDHLRTVVTDEGKYDAINAAFASADSGFGNVSLTVALKKAGATRTYAIPGRERCLQCHMGSPTRDFVLGFLPLQINRRPLDVGGVIEEPGPDDLSQLQRFIDYGLITGISSPSDVLPLEKSQGTRAPRNDYELVAQGYMLGNCAHCHNPRGFPSIRNKDTLQNVLSFLPGTAPGQGIFQFPLELYSQRITRDLPRPDGTPVRLPYITPSLVDYPGVADYDHTAAHGPTSVFQGLPQIDKNNSNHQAFTPDYMVIAPWRSLIYRNVDTPFAYADDLALFPHMPMNVPGYDCRITRIMGDWMVSIPAVRKPGAPQISLVQSDGYAADGVRVHNNEGTDLSEQPYAEVLPTDSGYDAAVADAKKRLDLYHGAGISFYVGAPMKTKGYTNNDYARYSYCPDTTDIVDYTVTDSDNNHLVPGDVEILSDGKKTYRRPADYLVNNQYYYTEDATLLPSSAKRVWPPEGVPDRPHWVITDNTDLAGDWRPRRTDWDKILGKHDYKTLQQTGDDLVDVTKNVIEVLNPPDPSKPGLLLKDIDDFAMHPFPYGLWTKKSECATKLASARTLDSYTGAERLRWMDKPDPKTGASRDGKSPVYEELPGAAVYNMVCINCHGPQADSKGRQADTLAIMSGGNARVADFKDGLFGPADKPGANIDAVFSPKAWEGGVGPAGSEDWAARYMAFMALGGTSKRIPKAILNIVATTSIFGTVRSIPGVDSANMLGPIQTLCSQLFGVGLFADKVSDTENPAGAIGWVFGSDFDKYGSADTFKDVTWGQTIHLSKFNATLLDSVGDAELLARMCSLNNPPPIRMLSVLSTMGPIDLTGFADQSQVPSDTIVGTDRGTFEKGISPTNYTPWCVIAAASGDFLKTEAGKNAPLCPSGLTPLYYKDLWRWSSRGAINAGLSVFEYLKWLKIQKHDPVPPYDQCEKL